MNRKHFLTLALTGLFVAILPEKSEASAPVAGAVKATQVPERVIGMDFGADDAVAVVVKSRAELAELYPVKGEAAVPIPDFMPGDVVCLSVTNGVTPPMPMTVERVYGDIVRCVWFDGNACYRQGFNTEHLTLVSMPCPPLVFLRGAQVRRADGSGSEMLVRDRFFLGKGTDHLLLCQWETKDGATKLAHFSPSDLVAA